MICSNTQHGPYTTNRQLSISTSLSKELNDLRIENPLNVILFYLNINSIRNNSSDLQQVISDSVAILAIAETKIDSTLPPNSNRFKIIIQLTVQTLVTNVEVFLLTLRQMFLYVN